MTKGDTARSLGSVYTSADAATRGLVATPEEIAAGELLALNRILLDSIANADWDTYLRLTDPSVTCFEPEANGCLVEGIDFHKFYFQLGGISTAHNTTMTSPRVRVMGSIGVVTYVRLTQRLDDAGKPITKAAEETRVWQRIDGQWRQVHFHRSPTTTRIV